MFDPHNRCNVTLLQNRSHTKVIRWCYWCIIKSHKYRSVEVITCFLFSFVNFLFRVESFMTDILSLCSFLVIFAQPELRISLHIVEWAQIRKHLNTMTRLLNYCKGAAITLRNDNDLIISYSVQMGRVRIRNNRFLLIWMESYNRMLIVKIYRIGALFYFVLQGN